MKILISRGFARFLGIWVLAAACPAAYATSVRGLEIDEVVRDSGQVFYGRVVSITEGVVPGMNIPYSEYTFAVSEWVRGGSGQTVTIRQIRGQAGPGLPAYKKGQELVLCLHSPSRIGLTSPVGIQQGYYPVLKAAGGQRLVQLGSMSASVGRRRAALKGPSAPDGPADRLPLGDFLQVLRGIH